MVAEHGGVGHSVPVDDVGRIRSEGLADSWFAHDAWEARRRGTRPVPVHLEAPSPNASLLTGDMVGQPQRPCPRRVLAQVFGGAEAVFVVEFVVADGCVVFREHGHRSGRGNDLHFEVSEGRMVESYTDLDELGESDLRSQRKAVAHRVGFGSLRCVRDGQLLPFRLGAVGLHGRQVGPGLGQVHGRLGVHHAEGEPGVVGVASVGGPVLKGDGFPLRGPRGCLAGGGRQNQFHVPPGQAAVLAADQRDNARYHRGGE